MGSNWPSNGGSYNWDVGLSYSWNAGFQARVLGKTQMWLTSTFELRRSLSWALCWCWNAGFERALCWYWDAGLTRASRWTWDAGLERAPRWCWDIGLVSLTFWCWMLTIISFAFRLERRPESALRLNYELCIWWLVSSDFQTVYKDETQYCKNLIFIPPKSQIHKI